MPDEPRGQRLAVLCGLPPHCSQAAVRAALRAEFHDADFGCIHLITSPWDGRCIGCAVVICGAALHATLLERPAFQVRLVAAP
jgi:hypothetical protein